MANLIGYLYYYHHAEMIHRLAHKQISSELATRQGKIRTHLDKDGSCLVTVNGKTVYKGNVNKK